MSEDRTAKNQEFQWKTEFRRRLAAEGLDGFDWDEDRRGVEFRRNPSPDEMRTQQSIVDEMHREADRGMEAPALPSGEFV
ncbi:MAG: hypothetical protein R3234_04535 [Thermoanaerobaculia bacterium]|nr:hypothetical protein [Thermoanaerobaculia bacterium]